MKYLVIIPARGGSKGVINKNIRPLKGKPLIYYTTEVARSIFNDVDVCVSTDSYKIKSIVEKTGLKVPFLRPDELSTDTAGSYEVILHAIDFAERSGRQYDAVIFLQPTSPLRTRQHILEAIELFSQDIDMVVSVKETNSNPYYVLFEEDTFGYLQKSKKGSFLRRQDCPKVWEFNGGIYIINVKSLRENKIGDFDKIVKYEMDEYSSVDIDSYLDFIIAETILSANKC